MGRGRPRDPGELLLDDGVLGPATALEIGGWRGAEASGGTAVVPWRGDWLAARAAGVSAVGAEEEIGDRLFGQAVVHLAKGRDATRQAVAVAWARLEPGGRLLLAGGNELGVKSAVRRLEVELEQSAEVLVSRAHARVVRFERRGPHDPAPPATREVQLEVGGDRFALSSAPGVFSADEVDPASRLLLEHLDRAPGTLIFDPGCGLGVLALAALRGRPEATAVLADADRRAVDAARANLAALALGDRAEVHWWDATSEPPPLASCDVALVNPPFHGAGAAVDLAPARAIFAALGRTLSPGGRALVVANLTLPYERELAALGRCERLEIRHGFKLLLVRR